MNDFDLKKLLDEKAAFYNGVNFIENDPVIIPHRYSKPQDIEVSGFFAAILAWGNRKSIIKSCERLMERMDNAPYEFIKNHAESDLKKLENFVHRTFNSTDLLFLLARFKTFYEQEDSLEYLFLPNDEKSSVKSGLQRFHEACFEVPYAPLRSQKHIASPQKKSACKRLNMFLRWMVRKDDQGVDFGIWNKISPSQLICPLDVHVIRVANSLGLINSEKSDWKTAEHLTQRLQKFDPLDPVKYDFALFGMGLEKWPAV